MAEFRIRGPTADLRVSQGKSFLEVRGFARISPDEVPRAPNHCYAVHRDIAAPAKAEAAPIPQRGSDAKQAALAAHPNHRKPTG